MLQLMANQLETTHTLCDSGGYGEEVGVEARDVKLDWEHRTLGHHLFLTNTIF